MYSAILLGALAGSAFAQISFSNTTFTAPVKVGSTWPVSFSAGDSKPVAIGFGNSTYAFQIVDGLTAPGIYSWKVAVPVNVVEGIYQLALVQGDSDPVFSPAFYFVIPPESSSSTSDAPTTSLPFPSNDGAGVIAITTETTTVTAIYLPSVAPNATHVTYIYYDDACACHQTSTCPINEVPTAATMTTVTYSEAACGCTTTVKAPCQETVIPVAPVVPVAPAPAPMPTAAIPSDMPAAPAAPASPATNTPMAPSAAPVAPTVADAALTTFTGAAQRLACTSFGFLGLLVALVVA